MVNKIDIYVIYIVLLEFENLGYVIQLIFLLVKDCLVKDVWEGVRYKYWQLDIYYFFVC